MSAGRGGQKPDGCRWVPADVASASFCPAPSRLRLQAIRMTTGHSPVNHGAKPRILCLIIIHKDTEVRFAEEALRLTRGEGVHVVYGGSAPSTTGIDRRAAPVWHVLLVWPGSWRSGTLDIMKLPKSIGSAMRCSATISIRPELFARARRSSSIGFLLRGET